MKNDGQPIEDSVPWNSWYTKDPRWLNNVFLFSTEFWAEHLKNHPVEVPAYWWVLIFWILKSLIFVIWIIQPGIIEKWQWQNLWIQFQPHQSWNSTSEVPFYRRGFSQFNLSTGKTFVRVFSKCSNQDVSLFAWWPNLVDVRGIKVDSFPNLFLHTTTTRQKWKETGNNIIERPN